MVEECTAKSRRDRHRWPALFALAFLGASLLMSARPAHAQANPISICGFVFRDANCNGVHNAGENGLNGVTVRLLNAAGVQIAQLVTGNNPKPNPDPRKATGFFDFINLPRANYTIVMVVPSGFSPSGAFVEPVSSHGTVINATTIRVTPDSPPDPERTIFSTQNFLLCPCSFDQARADILNAFNLGYFKCPVADTLLLYLNIAEAAKNAGDFARARFYLQLARDCACKLTREIDMRPTVGGQPNPDFGQPFSTLGNLQDLANFHHTVAAQTAGRLICADIDCLLAGIP